VGRALVRRLLAAGDQVRVLARPSPRADALEKLGVEIIRGDVADKDAVSRAVQGMDVVYHTAAIVEPPSPTPRSEFLATNVEGTQNLFELCARHGVPHVVHLSSIAVYGIAKSGETIDEITGIDQEPSCRDAYSGSKIEADNYAAAIGSKTKLSVTILLPGVVYGPGKPLPIALLGFSRHRKQLVVFGRRSQRFPLIFVENLVDAMQIAGRVKDGRLRRYILIDDDDLTLGAYHALRSELQGTRTIFLTGWPLLLGPILWQGLAWVAAAGSNNATALRRQIRRALQDRHYDSSLIRRETGWSPKVSLRDAIRLSLQSSE
jgi:nucleoside-diphosphate-sugar epimerase